MLVGDVVVASSFIAYIAPFNASFRADLWSGKWMPDIVERKIPSTEGFKPMDLLTDASTTAGWRTEGLPADPLSTENAAIIVKAARFPLIIDPQLQATPTTTNPSPTLTQTLPLTPSLSLTLTLTLTLAGHRVARAARDAQRPDPADARQQELPRQGDTLPKPLTLSLT